MNISPGIADFLAISMLGVVVYSVGRLIAGSIWHRRVERDTELAHVAMGLSMAAMFEPRLEVLPHLAWVGVFVGSTLWFVGRAFLTRYGVIGASSIRHSLSLVVESAAMIYMLVAVPSWLGMDDLVCGARMVGMMGRQSSPTKLPILGLALAILLVAQAGVVVDRQFCPQGTMECSSHSVE